MIEINDNDFYYTYCDNGSFCCFCFSISPTPGFWLLPHLAVLASNFGVLYYVHMTVRSFIFNTQGSSSKSTFGWRSSLNFLYFILIAFRASIIYNISYLLQFQNVHFQHSLSLQNELLIKAVYRCCKWLIFNGRKLRTSHCFVSLFLKQSERYILI